MNASRNRSVLLAFTTSFLYGHQAAIISGASLFLPATFPGLDERTYMLSLLVSCILFAAPFGSFLFSRLADDYGRRLAILSIHAVFILGSLVQASAPHVALVFLGRLILGLAIGGTTAVVPAYISEVSPADSRGMYGTFMQFCTTFGIATAFISGFGFSCLDRNQWRFMVALPALISLIPFYMRKSLHESPRWLQKVGRRQDARNLLILWGMDVPLLLEASSDDDTANITIADHTWTSLLNTCPRELALAVVVNVLQQFSGFNVLVYYSGIVFKQVGFTSRSALLASALSALPQLLVLFVVAKLLDKYGRKLIMTVSCACLMLAMIFMAFLPHFDERQRKWLAFPCILLARVSFSLGLGPVPSLYAAEVLPNRYRAKGMAIASSSNWIANLMVSSSFLPMSEYLHAVLPGDLSWIFLVYASVLLFGIGWCWAVMKETSCMQLADIEADEEEETDIVNDEVVVDRDAVLPS